MTLAAIMSLIVIAILVSLSIKGKAPEITAVVGTGLCLLIIGICISRLKVISEMIRNISEHISINGTYIEVLLKMIGVSYICEFAAGISKDAGYTAVASQIELVGKLTMLAIGMPVVLSVINKVVSLLG